MNVEKKIEKNYDALTKKATANKLWHDKEIIGIREVYNKSDLFTALLLTTMGIFFILNFSNPFLTREFQQGYNILRLISLVLLGLFFVILGISSINSILRHLLRVYQYNQLLRKKYFIKTLESVWEVVNIPKDKFEKQFINQFVNIKKLIFTDYNIDCGSFIDLNGDIVKLESDKININTTNKLENFNLYEHRISKDKSVQKELEYYLYDLKINKSDFMAIFKSRSIILHKLFVEQKENVQFEEIVDVSVEQYRTEKNVAIKKFLKDVDI